MRDVTYSISTHKLSAFLSPLSARATRLIDVLTLNCKLQKPQNAINYLQRGTQQRSNFLMCQQPPPSPPQRANQGQG